MLQAPLQQLYRELRHWLPAIYRMTLQQITYWQARAAAGIEAPGIPH
jgi:hypothetical protein